MLRLKAIVSGGLVPVEKCWIYDEEIDLSSLGIEIRLLLEESWFWSHPAEPFVGRPDGEQLYIEIDEGTRKHDVLLPLAGCDLRFRGLRDFILPRLEWRPRNL